MDGDLFIKKKKQQKMALSAGEVIIVSNKPFIKESVAVVTCCLTPMNAAVIKFGPPALLSLIRLLVRTVCACIKLCLIFLTSLRHCQIFQFRTELHEDLPGP